MIRRRALRSEGLGRQEIGGALLGRQAIGPLDDVEDAAAVVVEQHDAQIRRHMGMPEAVAVVEEAQVAHEQTVGRVGAASAAPTAVLTVPSMPLVPRLALMVAGKWPGCDAEQIRVANRHAVAELQTGARRQGLEHAGNGGEFAKGRCRQQPLMASARPAAPSVCQCGP